MSYRKITVNEKTYEYVIGKKFTKIKGFGIFPHEKWANYVPQFNPEKDVLPPSLDPKNAWYVIKPSNVRNMILGVPRQEAMMVDPFSYEIYGKTIYFDYNLKAYQQYSWDI